MFVLAAVAAANATACNDQADPRIVAYVESISADEVCFSTNDRLLEFRVGCYPYDTKDEDALVVGSCVWVRVPDPVVHDEPETVAARDVSKMPDRSDCRGKS